MLRYFVAAQLWLLLALAIFVGRTIERMDPTRYSVFRLGQWFEPTQYWCLVGVCIAVSVICFIFYGNSRRKSGS
jgi:hypothetical protein